MSSVARANEPFVWLRGELGGGLGLNGEFGLGGDQESALGGHIGGQIMLRLVGPFGITARAAGTYFTPFQKKPDALHASWSGGLALRADGFWLAALAGLHESQGDNKFGLDGLIGYEFLVGKNFGLGPFAGYSIMFEDDPLQFLEFGLSVALGLPFESGDTDGDGIPDDRDRCPSDPEDRDGFQDDDGCPDRDNDNDGIPDDSDQCRDEAEDIDQFEDDNGCPDPDNDGDGIPDDRDQCPDEREDVDQFQDEDGCPDPDNDGDGIPDASDRCPTEAEDRDEFQDEDGCPDPDNDGDGVLDVDDECPTAPGPAPRGCPQAVRLERGRIRILQRIEFETNRDRLLPSAFPILEEVKAVLEVNPQIRKVRVEGHTDDRGNDRHNQDLSQRRAASVVRWLTEHGVAADRLEPQGFGESRPLVPNTNAENRQTNRRVEFVITDPATPPEEAGTPAPGDANAPPPPAGPAPAPAPDAPPEAPAPPAP